MWQYICCDKLKMWQNSNCDNTQSVTKLKKNNHFDKTEKGKLWQKLNWQQNSINDKTSKEWKLLETWTNDEMFSGQLFLISQCFLCSSLLFFLCSSLVFCCIFFSVFISLLYSTLLLCCFLLFSVLFLLLSVLLVSFLKVFFFSSVLCSFLFFSVLIL